MPVKSASITLFSPAKLNLFFRVLNRREDGYHEIASLFQAVSLGDYLSMERSEIDELICDKTQVPCDASNLIFKALILFRKKTGLNFSVKFHLKKRIPMQSGLGGGSSNAATALWGLNQLCGQPATIQDLQKWAAEIGSDVSFFFSQGTAYCRGRGEIVEEMPSLKSPSLWIAKPKEALSTPLVYQSCQPKQMKQVDIQAALKGFYEGKGHYFNDLECAAFELVPSLQKLKRNLLDMGFETVSMTGSGTAFICIGNKPPSPLSDVQFHQVNYIYRNEENWYPNDKKL